MGENCLLLKIKSVIGGRMANQLEHIVKRCSGRQRTGQITKTCAKGSFKENQSEERSTEVDRRNVKSAGLC